MSPEVLNVRRPMREISVINPNETEPTQLGVSEHPLMQSSDTVAAGSSARARREQDPALIAAARAQEETTLRQQAYVQTVRRHRAATAILNVLKHMVRPDIADAVLLAHCTDRADHLLALRRITARDREAMRQQVAEAARSEAEEAESRSATTWARAKIDGVHCGVAGAISAVASPISAVFLEQAAALKLGTAGGRSYVIGGSVLGAAGLGSLATFSVFARCAWLRTMQSRASAAEAVPLRRIARALRTPVAEV